MSKITETSIWHRSWALERQKGLLTVAPTYPLHQIPSRAQSTCLPANRKSACFLPICYSFISMLTIGTHTRCAFRELPARWATWTNNSNLMKTKVSVKWGTHCRWAMGGRVINPAWRDQGRVHGEDKYLKKYVTYMDSEQLRSQVHILHKKLKNRVHSFH